MNRYQKLIILGGIIAIGIMGLYPPWKMTLEYLGRNGTIKIERFWRYSYFFKPPEPPKNGEDAERFDYFFGTNVMYRLLGIDPRYKPKEVKTFGSRHIFEARLDYMRLLFQWIFVVLITSGLVLIFHWRE